MQSQRSTVLPEAFEFDHGSSSNNTGVDESHYWNNVLSPVDSRNLPDFLLPSTDTTAAYTSSVGQSSGNLPSWNLGAPISSDQTRFHSSHEDAKVEQPWSDSFTSRPGPLRLEERRFDSSNVLSLDGVNINLNSNQVAGGSRFSQGSTSSDLFQNTNLNAGLVGNGSHLMEPHAFKPGGSEAVHGLHSTGALDPCASASGTTVDYLAEAGEARQVGSMDGRRLSCKRKALDGVSGQSSLGASPSLLQRAECSAWHPVSARHNTGSSLSISNGPVEQSSSVNPHEELLSQRLGSGMRTLVTPENRPVSFTVNENSQRNFRVRINPGQQQVSTAPNSLWAASGNVNPMRAPAWSSHQISQVPPFNHLVESRAAGTAAASTSTSSASHLPTYPRSLNPYSLHGASSSRVGSLPSTPVISGERAATFREEVNSRTIPRSISARPMFVPGTDVRSLPNGNMNVPANVASSSRGSSSAGGIHPVSGVTWIAQHGPPPHHQRRLSEIVRRSLLPSSEAGAQSTSFPTVGPPGPNSQEMLLPSGSSHHGGNQHSYLRSALWMDRQGDGVLGVPLSLRTLTAAPEGRSRLASEIHNVLDLVRRGESIRFEDFVILDQSVFYGVADLHDRHRDMRLDVDNMSYEELLALEERIGNVNTGLTKETVLKCLKQQTYAVVTTGESQDIEPCCICQEEYVEGEQLGTLDCGHDFHTACIKQWLMLKNLCPICKTTALVM